MLQESAVSAEFKVEIEISLSPAVSRQKDLCIINFIRWLYQVTCQGFVTFLGILGDMTSVPNSVAHIFVPYEKLFHQKEPHETRRRRHMYALMIMSYSLYD